MATSVSRNFLVAAFFALTLVGTSLHARTPGAISKDGWRTGERQNLEVDIAFSGGSGETVTDGNGTTYNFLGNSQWENKIYPPEYWGVFPLYFFGQPVGITVSVENKSPVNTARLSISTESYVLKPDASNAGTLLEPSSFYMEVAPNETKTFDASFTTEWSEGLDSGLDRFLVKVYEGSQPSDGAIDFEVQDTAVVPLEPFRAQIEVLGSAISYGGQYDMPVTMQLKLGSGTIAPFGSYSSPTGGNVNDDNNPRLYQLTEASPAGTAISFSGLSWVKKSSSYSGSQDSHWKHYLQVHSNSNSANLVVLKNGDTVLNVPGYLSQANVKDYLAPYLNGDVVVLDDTQVIFLFELGTTNMGSTAADFQDLVILVTLQEADNTGGAGEAQGDLILMKEGVFCPPELEQDYINELLGTLP